MSPPESPSPDPIDGDLTEPPPSDLSEYTWDDSETARLEPGSGEARGESASVARERLIGDDIGRFIDTLIQNRLVAEPEIRALSARLFPDGENGRVQPLATELIRLGKLTPYQAAAICQGKTKGLVIGGYIVLDKIGSGGMGLVLRARHRQSERIVALKLLPPSVSRDRAAVIRFRREAAAVARFRHPNIVSAIDSGETHGLLYLVMEFVDGWDLARTVKEKGPLSAAQTIDCIIQAARGLQEAHDHGIVHRDIKPANLLLDSSGTVKVLDLGLARVNQTQEMLAAAGSEADLTVSGSIVGTVDYMSPEQAYDPRMADGRSDIYSLGCTLHYLLTGRSPFGGQTFMERLLGHRERPIPSLLTSRRDVSEALDATFQHLLAKSPQDRPQTMAAVISELQECRGSRGGKASRPVMAFGGRPEKAPEPESIYEVARPQRDKNQPPSEVLSTVFVRHRSASSNRLAKRRKTLARDRWRLVAAVVIVVTGLMVAWRFLR
ncbi:MAG TPA: serine/threonine-protein kinase [Isosphaeraceae bacterium]|nr:serine/threonine-protein kinase [Isosphaeraceae bacterium]